MHKFLIVFKHEYSQVVKKKSFLVGLIITPLFMGAMMLGPAMLAKTKASTTEHLVVIDQTNKNIGNEFVESLKEYTLEDSVTAYYSVDQLLEIDSEESERFTQLSDSLKNLILEKELKYVLVITPLSMDTDTGVYIVSSADNIVSYGRFRWELSRIISSKRLEVSNINIPVDSVLNMTQRIDLVTKDLQGKSIDFGTKFAIAFIFVLMMYMLILINGQMVMRSVIDEKNSKIMEVLVSSVTPFQLMLGKIFGLGAATFTQIAIWILAGFAFLSFGSAMSADQVAIQQIAFNPYLLIFFVIYFILGFLFYSTLFALLGSVFSNEKEATNFLTPIVMCLILPVMIGMNIIQDPNSLVARILSFIPLFSPTMMVMRLNVIIPSLPNYSLIQPAFIEIYLSILVLAVSVIGIIWLTSKIFRIGILMTGKRVTLPEILKWVKQ